MLNKSKFFSGFSHFKHGKKNKFSVYFSARFWDSHLCIKRKFLIEFPPKCFKTTERHSLAVCGPLCGEKQFLLIFIPFYWLMKKSCLNKSKFSTGFSPFNPGKKNKFLSCSVLVSERVTFMSKKKSSLWIFPKLLQNNRKP